MRSQVYVDQKICIGCGLCVSIVPEVFRLNDAGVSEAYRLETAEHDEKIQQAIDGCPVNCISWR